MRYYSLRYVDKLPNGFGGLATLWKIKILEKYRHDKGLLEHEKVHVRCWYYCLGVAWLAALAMYFGGTAGWWFPVLLIGPFLHGVLYRNKRFRRLVEVRAYRIQLKEGGYKSPQFAINALMFKYGLGMSERAAKEALGLPPLLR